MSSAVMCSMPSCGTSSMCTGAPNASRARMAILAAASAPGHVLGGVGLGVAELLGLGERVRVGGAGALHGGQDEVGGAVHDAVHALDVGGGQRLGDHADRPAPRRRPPPRSAAAPRPAPRPRTAARRGATPAACWRSRSACRPPWRAARSPAPARCHRSARRSGRCARGCRRSRRGWWSARPRARAGSPPRRRSRPSARPAAARTPRQPCRDRAGRPGTGWRLRHHGGSGRRRSRGAPPARASPSLQNTTGGRGTAL